MIQANIWKPCTIECDGWHVFNGNQIQRCGTAGRFATDEEAVGYVAQRMGKRLERLRAKPPNIADAFSNPPMPTPEHRSDIVGAEDTYDARKDAQHARQLADTLRAPSLCVVCSHPATADKLAGVSICIECYAHATLRVGELVVALAEAEKKAASAAFVHSGAVGWSELKALRKGIRAVLTEVENGKL